MTELVRYRNEINRAGYKLDVVEMRIIYTAISKIFESGMPADDKTLHIITADDLRDLSSNQDNIYRDLKIAAKTLYNRSITLTENDAENNSVVRTFRWIYEVAYFNGEGKIGIKFSPSVIPFLNDLKKEFTQFDRREVKGISSSYAVRLYSMLMQFRKARSFFIKLDDLRQRFELQDKFPLYGDLRRRVIDVSVKQITEAEQTKIKVSYKEIKKGRKVVALQFLIEDKEILQSAEQAEDIQLIEKKNIEEQGKLSEARATLTDKQREMIADWLLKPNEQIDFVPSRFLEFLYRSKKVEYGCFTGMNNEQIKVRYLFLLADPKFVIDIYDPWLKKLGVIL